MALARRIAVAVAALLGLALAVFGAWFAFVLGPKGTAAFEATSNAPLVIGPNVLNRVNAPVTVSADAASGPVFLGAAVPQDVDQLVGQVEAQLRRLRVLPGAHAHHRAARVRRPPGPVGVPHLALERGRVPHRDPGPGAAVGPRLPQQGRLGRRRRHRRPQHLVPAVPRGARRRPHRRGLRRRMALAALADRPPRPTETPPPTGRRPPRRTRPTRHRPTEAGEPAEPAEPAMSVAEPHTPETTETPTTTGSTELPEEAR